MVYKNLSEHVSWDHPMTARKYREKLSYTHESIFKKFFDLGSLDIQNSYLFDWVYLRNKKRSHKKKAEATESSRKITTEYSVNVKGQDVKICKVEYHLLESVVPQIDKRNNHENKPNEVSDEQRQSVRNHSDLIPKYQSHYNRADNLNKTFLNHDMTIAELYKKLYIPWCEEQYIVSVKKKYKKMFVLS